MIRLIDADAIEKVLEEKHFNRVLDSDRWLIADIKKSIMDLPTIDAEPVRHGKWIFESIRRRGVMTCSECRKMQDYQTLCFTYCPNCGCRMDEV